MKITVNDGPERTWKKQLCLATLRYCTSTHTVCLQWLGNTVGSDDLTT